MIIRMKIMLGEYLRECSPKKISGPYITPLIFDDLDKEVISEMNSIMEKTFKVDSD